MIFANDFTILFIIYAPFIMPVDRLCRFFVYILYLYIYIYRIVISCSLINSIQAQRVMYMLGILVISFMTTFVSGRTFENEPPSILTTSTLAPEKPIEPPPPLNGTCFNAEPELCQEFNESEICKECMPHPVYTNALVCCNVTDLEKSISCLDNISNDSNKTVWTNIHVRNATIDELDISLKLWKLLDSLAITDGQINRIVREFPKFSQPKCLNLSNNNLHTIPTRALKDLTRLQTLDLSHNNLSTVPNLNNLNLALDVR